MPIEKRTFEKGMNQDLAESLMSPGMYRYALNIRNGNSERGAVGVITNAEGNQEFSVTLPAGGNRVIGAYDDEAHDRVIYIVHNTEGDNRIFAYNYEEGIVQTVVSDSNNVLDLNVDYLVTAINVVADQSTEYLLFTDNYGEPKNIDIQAGIRTYDTAIDTGLYTYRKFLGDFDTVSPTTANKDDVYSREIAIRATNGFLRQITIYYRATKTTTQDPTVDLTNSNPQSDWEICPAGFIYGNHTEENFTNIVKKHSNQVEGNYESANADYNFLEGSLFQFKVKYVRADGRESCWSPINKFLAPEAELDSIINIEGYNNSRLLNNSIRLYIDAPDASVYKSIKIAVRRSMDDRTPSDWQLAENLDITDYESYIYDDGVQIQYVFDGSNAQMPLDTNDTSQLMSWIPKKAKAQSITSRNRILYSNFTEGQPYDLNGEYSINRNSPIVYFLERDNPYNTTTDSIPIVRYTSSAIASVITEETTFDPFINSIGGNGLAFQFPSSVKAGTLYSIKVEISYRLIPGSAATAAGFKQEDFNIKTRSTKVDLIAQTSATSALIDSFVNQINYAKDLYVSSIQTINANGRINNETFILDKSIATAQSITSGGNDYLLVLPIPKETILAGGGGYDFDVEFFYRKVPRTSVGLNFKSIQSFKRGSQQQFGISYSDKYGRLSTVIEHDAFSQYNPWWIDTNETVGTAFSDIGQRYAQIALNHDAPSWATHYHILKTNSNGINNYVSFPLSIATGLPKLTNGADNPLDGKYYGRGFIRRDIGNVDSGTTLDYDTIDDMELIYIPLTSLQNSLVGYTNLNEAPLAYDFTPGDRIRIAYSLTYGVNRQSIPTTTGAYFESTADAEILFYDTELNSIAIRPNDLPLTLVGAGGILATDNQTGSGVSAGQSKIRGLLCEIYSPTKEKNTEFYYEMFTGTVSADTANSRYYHVGNQQTQNSAQGAVIELDNGDSFIKGRTYTIKSTITALTNTAKTQVFNYFVEEGNFYDKITSKSWGAGRPNRSIRSTSLEEDITGFLGESVRPTTIRYSEPLLPEQGYNGLGTVHDLNFKDANGAMKSIQHMHTEGSKTIVFHENAVGVAESDRAVVTTLDENNMTIGANTPLSDVVYYGTRAGIGTNPESFANNNNRKYFVDIDQGQVCRLSQDGVTPISDAGMDKYFKEVFRDMIQSPQVDYAFGAYDKRTDEYTLNLKWTDTISVQEVGGATFTASPTFTVQYTADTSAYDYYIGQSLVVEGQPWTDFTDPNLQPGFAPTSVYVSNVSGSTITLQFTEEQWDNSNFDFVYLGSYPARKINVYAFKSITLTYSEKTKSWTSFHSYVPENITSAGLNFVSFKAGKLYTHDDYNNPMSYYGVDYPSYIDIISNMGGDQVKIWKTMALKATTDDAEVVEADFLIPVSSADTTDSVFPISGGVEDSRGKLSTGTTFVSKENQLYSEYMRTGTGTDYTGYIEGDKVRGYWVYTRFKINSGISKIYKIISASFDFLMSNYTR